MNKFLRFGPVAAALVLPLAACGGSSSSGQSANATSAAVKTSAASSMPSASSSSSSAKQGADGAKGKKSGSGNASSGAGDAKDGNAGVPTSSAVNISIPSIGLNHSIVGGGLSGGVLSPPPGAIIQFTGYNRVIPGQNGIAVLAGHVTYNGPDVFYSLHNAAPGSAVTIKYADGTTKKFVVFNKASVNKDTLQNDSRVWGSSATPVVALVTCDANSGWANAHHHLNNFVVWARPA